MRTALSLFVVMLTRTTTLANAPPPGEKYQRYYAVISLTEPAGGWTYFSEPSGGYGIQRLGQASRFEIRSPGWSGTFTKPSVVVWAVRTSECAGLSDEAVEDHLKDLERQGSAVHSERIELGYWRSSLSDVNDGIEKHYRLERTDTELKLHFLGERTRWGGFVFVVCGSLALGVVLLASWVVWRWRKAKVRVSRATSPESGVT